MVEAAVLEEISYEDLLPRVRLDKAVITYHDATPTSTPGNKVRVFRASAMHSFCPVESAFAIKLIKKKAWDKVQQWNRTKTLPGKVIPIVDTGTVVHKQLQYYAGLTRKVRKGQWRCPACGFLTHRKVAMPMVEVLDKLTDLDVEYPAPCPKCKGGNLYMFPPWLYVEPQVQEKVKGVPEMLKVTGHIDGLWEVRVRVGKQVVWVRVIVDYKTINKNGFEEKYGGGLPKQEHVPQMQTYLNLADVEFGLIIYYCKDNSQQKYRFVKRNRSYWVDILKKVKWARKGNLKAKADYRVCPNVGHPKSRECFFQEACWGKKAPENFLA